MSETRDYMVIYEGTFREVYIVNAASEDEARMNWSDSEPVISEAIDGEVVEVKVATDE